MSKRWSRSWWSSLGLGKPAADDSDDFGDMGTAFGLDASMAGGDDGDLSTGNGHFDCEAPAPKPDRFKRRF